MRVIFFDCETSGLKPEKDRIIEINLEVYTDGSLVDRYHRYITYDKKLSEKIIKLTSITDDLLKEKGTSEAIVAEDLKTEYLTQDTLWVAHNIQFDLNFIYELLKRQYGHDVAYTVLRDCLWLDTLTIFKDRKQYPHKLSDMIEYYNIDYSDEFHNAVSDSRVLYDCLNALLCERNDIREYVNVIGFNRNYGVFGELFDFISYYPQEYNFRMKDVEDILPRLYLG